MSNAEDRLEGIAIVGLAGRFPGAFTVDDFWSLIREGREGLRDLTEQELLNEGIDPRDVFNPFYVRRAGILDRVDEFAASFFGISARQAELMDPQHRLFLESAWEALESGGCDPERFKGRIGVFAGCALSA